MSLTSNSPIASLEDALVFKKSGQVVGSAVWSETHVSGGGGGGGGSMHGGIGSFSTSPIWISSEARQGGRFFLREENGMEAEFNAAPINVRDGHWVTVVYVGHKKENTGWPVYFYNHNTKTQRMDNRVLEAKISKPLVTVCFALLFPFLMFEMTASLAIVMLAAVPPIVAVRRYAKAKAIEKFVKEKSDALIVEASREVNLRLASASVPAVDGASVTPAKAGA